MHAQCLEVCYYFLILLSLLNHILFIGDFWDGTVGEDDTCQTYPENSQ